MIWQIFKTRARKPTGLATVPDGTRVYAVGDIHGQVDLLRQLHELIGDDSSRATVAARNLAIYVGDYVDRGLESRGVIELLLRNPLSGFETIYLKGNHEELFLKFLDDPAVGPSWFELGGDATAYSYGIRVPQSIPPEDRFSRIREELLAAVPKPHLDFLSGLRLTYEAGDYFFVHAGIRPGRALDEQWPEDLLWIRDEFTNSRAGHGKIVVHGHSVSFKPEICENRIGIDTGAYVTNNLTCLVLEKDTKRFLSTSGQTESSSA